MASEKIRRRSESTGLQRQGAKPIAAKAERGAAQSSRGLSLTLSVPQSGSPAQIRRMQGAFGNRAVQSLLAPAVQRQTAAGPQGGALDSSVQSQIESQRGGGQPVDSAVAGQVGQSLGADFSRVRVHTGPRADRLNRTLNAKAFTTGSDIFFSQGKYSPGSSGGQQLLAHELTHVAQQGGASNRVQGKLNVGPAHDRFEQEADRMAVGLAAGPGAAMAGVGVQRQAAPVIQRAVGYEFETNYKIEKKNKGIKSWFNAYRPLKKMEVVESYTEGFRMEADENSTLGSTIEFVVDPPVQETERDKLNSILAKFGTVGGQLDAGKNAPDVGVPLSNLTGDNAHDDYRVTPKATGLTGNPQVTGGVSFDKIITMLGEIGGGAGARDPVANPHQGAKHELEGMSPQAPERAAQKGRAAGGSLKFQGMVALLSSYLGFGRKQTATYPPLNYAKLISNSLLVRTDFGKIFKKLDTVERTPFETNPDTFATAVLTAAGLPGTENTLVFERGVRQSQVRTSKKYNKLVKLPVTRGDWLKTITTGVDKLSSHHIPKLKATFEGLGALGPRTDRVGADPVPVPNTKDKGSGIIMEFRNMRKDVLYSDFVPLARGIFDYLVELNARQEPDEDDSDEDF